MERNLNVPLRTNNELQKFSQQEKRDVSLLGWDPPQFLCVCVCVLGGGGGDEREQPSDECPCQNTTI